MVAKKMVMKYEFPGLIYSIIFLSAAQEMVPMNATGQTSATVNTSFPVRVVFIVFSILWFFALASLRWRAPRLRVRATSTLNQAD
jgi:hypothetical protein